MILPKKLVIAAALALTGAAPIYAGALSYSEAAAPWSAEQAVSLPPAITADFIKAVKKDYGAAAASGLVEKREKVSALLNKFKDCSLGGADKKTADKYLDKKFGAEVRYFAGAGCAVFRESSAGLSAAPRAASLSVLENLSASGALGTAGGSARFFDGSSSKGEQAVISPAAGAPLRQTRAAAVSIPAVKSLSSEVPVPRSDNPPEAGTAGRPVDIGRDGRVNSAVAFWSAMRRENWTAYRKGGLTGAAKAKALLKAASAAGLGGLLSFSNLPDVEIAAARLRWDIKNNSGSRVITADSAKFVFHSGVFILALAPIPMLKVLRAAAAGKVWAISLLAGMSAGPINRYGLHLAD
ncbi:MAG: hypothetical protein AUJ51_13140 [Elusimicrobia bacterium CG1_02_56_21]|nr:MAG: hypothetical protein AUJ51_13140 [Elusimicrobia bacterium CG1_02_56_21]